MAEEKAYVKTVYSSASMRKPNVTRYDSKKDAKLMVRATLKWGIDIISCEIVQAPNLEEGNEKRPT